MLAKQRLIGLGWLRRRSDKTLGCRAEVDRGDVRVLTKGYRSKRHLLFFSRSSSDLDKL